MEASKNSFVFISVFFAQEKWHELLPIIRSELYDHSEMSGQISKSYVFFSSYRGSSIRIALKHEDLNLKKALERIVKPINAFLEKNPSNVHPVRLPISGFFADFTNNQIKYNLYNERVIMPGELAAFQLALSKILLKFFDDHPVDDDALFTLVVCLQEALLNALCDPHQSKQELISVLIAEVKRRNVIPQMKLIELKYSKLLPNTEEINGVPAIHKLLHWFEKAARTLYVRGGNKVATYFAIVQIIQLHLSKIYHKIFLDSLEYLAESLKSEYVVVYNEDTNH